MTTALPFRALIAAFRDTFRRGRTQTDITGQALLYKRQLEAHGMLPGYRPGTPARKHKITDRAARKEVARELGKQMHYHLKAGGTRDTFTFLIPGEFMRDTEAVDHRISLDDQAIIAAAMAAPVPAYHLNPPEEPGIVVGYNFDNPQPVAAPRYRVWEGGVDIAHLPPGFYVVGMDGHKVENRSPYKDRKTANRRAKQLNAA